MFSCLFLVLVFSMFINTESQAAKKYKYVWKTVTTKEYLGKYTITHYCSCRKCCGIYANGRTSTGKIAKAGRTIAVDPKQIPYGSKVKIGKKTYVAEDTGSAMRGRKVIDIFCKSHSEAMKKGRKYQKVWLIKKKKKKVKVRVS